METIIAYVPDNMVKCRLNDVANEVADGCAEVWGREKGTIPVMFHKIGAEDGNECAGQTIVFYVYANSEISREKKAQAAEKVCSISEKHFPDMKKENHLVIFKLHEGVDMGINGKREG